ncbi:Cytochrome C biogenesis protein [Caenorhabditis elegans]|uniref:Cytochrome C biogenesis protein n=1 Tax=Caenorhabditis elegans TaxID=6239 RepID=G5EEL8_CAEEL|nr:Cytochrome C biogenesis protein [Caenorhabditis elegans]NP_001293637.1 Cytochrome C biogenesis protein [Caenorhabditis elegans]CCD69201.1 Cytochrome C biogenesis protein [Caenorhabditis elegans]CCD69202.1 Cytochrome C biogenesis protein [Caenorhabditis elegans]|eukprot:NP_001122746.2 Uncharacterized protein CELE_ZC262.9 [Caenorhabditis elegans]
MLALKIVLGALLALSFVLNAVGVFTNEWVTSKYPLTVDAEFQNMKSLGIIPYRTEVTTMFPWFGVAEILMILTFVLFLLTIPLYGLLSFKARKDDLQPAIRAGFGALSAMSLTIFLFTIISVILIAVNLVGLNSILFKLSPESLSLGYSAWLCVVSSILMIGVFGASAFMSYSFY